MIYKAVRSRPGSGIQAPMANLRFRRTQIASLDAVQVEGSEESPTVVVFHGFGADMTDLAPLAQALALPESTNWVFPNGHLAVPLGGHFEGRGWFPISISELEKTMAGQALDLGGVVPPGLDEARDRGLEMLDALDVPPDQLILMGFSQGGMLAVDLAVRMKQTLRGLAILSGALVNADEWTRLAPAQQGLSFFQSHGVHDTVLSFAGAQKLESFLRGAGWKGQLMRFEGGHEIPPNVLGSLSAYLKRRLGS